MQDTQIKIFPDSSDDFLNRCSMDEENFHTEKNHIEKYSNQPIAKIIYMGLTNALRANDFVVFKISP